MKYLDWFMFGWREVELFSRFSTVKVLVMSHTYDIIYAAYIISEFNKEALQSYWMPV